MIFTGWEKESEGTCWDIWGLKLYFFVFYILARCHPSETTTRCISELLYKYLFFGLLFAGRVCSEDRSCPCSSLLFRWTKERGTTLFSQLAFWIVLIVVYACGRTQAHMRTHTQAHKVILIHCEVWPEISPVRF